MDFVLTDAEVRVLGCLIEKEMATPDYYPLSLNALQNACNQTSNRDPVVSYDEKTVAEALEALKAKRLVTQDHLGRVPKYSELFLKSANLVQREAAVLCVLMLRGAQTVGEIRGRTERLHSFASLEEAQKTLQTLEEWGYVALLPRQPGRKESRYAHLLSGPPENKEEAPSESVLRNEPIENEAVAKLEKEVKSLRQELEELKRTLHDFKAQFQ
ncbi:MAG: YceH family protein [Candidatus Manganitrophus sp.]|nr:YceH family protein [Candidatus Manganitrophus sp.]